MSADKSEKQKEQEFIIELINLYHSLNALWDVNSKDYSDKTKREDQNEILLKKYRERYPKATKKDVSRKINILRSNFKRELRRLSESKNDVNTTNLWYFDALSFIKDIKTTDVMWNNYAVKETPQRRKTKREETPVEEQVVIPLKQLKKTSNTFQKVSEVWVMKLQDMQLDQSLLAEKLINDVIFHGQLNNLNMDSKVVIECRSPSPPRAIECNQQYLKMENTFDLVQPTYANPVRSPEYIHQSMPALTGPYKPRVTVQNEKYFFE